LPLFEKARIEVYLPDLRRRAYQDLLAALDREFTYTFGGCTVMRGLDGSYLSNRGDWVRDRISLIYSDVTLPSGEHLEWITPYAEELRNAAFRALNEESVLVAVFKVLHAG
jgi:hypothetical protein